MSIRCSARGVDCVFRNSTGSAGFQGDGLAPPGKAEEDLPNGVCFSRWMVVCLLGGVVDMCCGWRGERYGD